jgi:hypothetical protein
MLVNVATHLEVYISVYILFIIFYLRCSHVFWTAVLLDLVLRWKNMWCVKIVMFLLYFALLCLPSLLRSFRLFLWVITINIIIFIITYYYYYYYYCTVLKISLMDDEFLDHEINIGWRRSLFHLYNCYSSCLMGGTCLNLQRACSDFSLNLPAEKRADVTTTLSWTPARSLPTPILGLQPMPCLSSSSGECRFDVFLDCSFKRRHGMLHCTQESEQSFVVRGVNHWK